MAGDTNGAEDIFVYDLTAGTTRRVSLSSAGAQGSAESKDASISADGRYVAFESYATNLAPDSNEVADVFVYDTSTGQTRRASVTANGGEIGPALCGTTNRSAVPDSFDPGNCGYNAGTDPAISADGRYIGFVSHIAGVTTGGTDGRPDVYVYDRTVNRTVTWASFGAPGSGGGGEKPVLSGDGRYVAFASDTALSTGDSNGVRDVYEYDRATGYGTQISADDFLFIQANGASDSPSMSSDGIYTAFSSLASNFTPYNHHVEDIFVHEWVEDDGTCGGVCTTSAQSTSTTDTRKPEAGDTAACTDQWGTDNAGTSALNQNVGRRCRIWPTPPRRRFRPEEPESECAHAGTQTQNHHIATNKNYKSVREGGPWSPRFRKNIFDPAKLSMNNKANTVPVVGHRGPHPREYHFKIYSELLAAVQEKRSAATKRVALVARLAELGALIKQPGTRLNELVTQGICDPPD